MTTSRIAFGFRYNPEHCAYFALLDLCRSLASHFSLVLRDDLSVSRELLLVLQNLEPYLVKKEQTSSWPGTVLSDGHAEVYRFRVDTDSIDVLKRYSLSLFDWQQPLRPEDPAFYYEDGSVLVETITHEADAILYISEEVFRCLPTDVSASLERMPVHPKQV